MALFVRFTKSNLLHTNKNYLIKINQPVRQLKSALKIKWVRPEKISCLKPEMSGDLVPLGSMDLKQFLTPYRASKELQSADELVQRIHTLEFFPRQKLKEEFIIEYSNRVKSHKWDDYSEEVKIARLTVRIRNLQIHVEKHVRDVISKVLLKETIEKRNKRLTQLRAKDYKRFEWLLEKLDIVHKVFGFNQRERVERKRSVRRLTKLYIEKLKSERLEEYKAALDAQKEGFFQEKLEKFTWMKKVEEESGVTPTVTEADIEAVQKQLQDLQIVQRKAAVAN